MASDHFLAMTLYALLTAAFFALLWRHEVRDRWRYFSFVFVSLWLGAVVAGWLMFPFPRHS